MSKEKPILFNTEMVRAILEGRKRQTRRVIKPQPVMDADGMWHWKDCQWMDGGLGFPASGIDDHAPYKPGDILWVRETWQSFFPEQVTPQHQQGPRSRAGVPAKAAKGHYMHYYYRADGEIEDAPEYGKTHFPEYGKTHFCKANWMSPIHMPKEAARIFLRVTDVRAERVQDISEEDAIAEGAAFYSPKFKTDVATIPWRMTTSRTKFCALWDSIYVKRGYGWDKNPWVWVYSFERVEKPAGWPGGEGGE